MFTKKEVRSALGAGLTLTALLSAPARAQFPTDAGAGGDVVADLEVAACSHVAGPSFGGAAAGCDEVAPDESLPRPAPSGGSLNGWLASAAIRASLERLLDRAHYGLASYEAAAWVVRDAGGISLREWSFSGAFERSTWHGSTPPGAVAIVHTHPLHVDARPSPGDTALAQRLRLPVYTLTRQGLWEAHADGTISREAPAPETCTRFSCLPVCGGRSGRC